MTTRQVNKPWGWEVIWAETDRYVGKTLYIKPGGKLSRQYHNHKDETFLVKRGELILELGIGADCEVLMLGAGDSFHCPPGTIHRMIAEIDGDGVEVIEVSTPELDDVVRLEDAYGREGTNEP